MASGAIGIGLSTYFALYLQSAVGLTPTNAGLLFIPLTGGIAIGSVTSGRIMSRTVATRSLPSFQAARAFSR